MTKTAFSVLLLSLLLASCTGNKEEEAPPAARAALVTVVESRLMDVPQVITAVGTVEPSATVTVVSRVAGELMEVHIYEGEQVEEGQLLFVIDKTQLEIDLLKAQANLEADRARLTKAEEDLARSQQMTRGGFSSAAQNDEARVAAASLRAALKVSEAQLEQAELNLSYCEIRAPMAGRAGALLVDQGNMIPALSEPLLVIDAHRPVTVTFAVPEKHIMAVRGMSQGNDLKVTAQPKLGRSAEGILTFVGNVDSNTGTVQLKATFSNDNGMMWPGEYVRLRLQLALEQDRVTVPSRAVTIGPDGTFVYVVSDDMKAHYRLVRTGTESDGLTVITDGLEAGEKVVMEGHVRLADGVGVRFPEEPRPQNAANDGTSS